MEIIKFIKGKALPLIGEVQFALTCEASGWHNRFELICRGLQILQLLSIVVPPTATAWKVAQAQVFCRYMLFSFGWGRVETYILEGVVFAYFATLARVAYEIHQHGSPQTSRFLSAARLFHFGCSTVLFLPICFNLLSVVVSSIQLLYSTQPPDIPVLGVLLGIHLTFLIVLFLLPITLLTWLAAPDYKAWNLWFTRTSSRQQLIVHFVSTAMIAVFCSFTTVEYKAFAGFAGTGLLVICSVLFPYYTSPLTSLLATASLCVPAWMGLVDVLMVVMTGSIVQPSVVRLPLLGALGWLPFAILVMGIQVLRTSHLLPWKVYLKVVFGQKMDTLQALQHFKQSRLPNDLHLLVHTCLFSNPESAPLVLNFLEDLIRRDPGEINTQVLIAIIQAFFLPETPKNRGMAQSAIRKLLGRGLLWWDHQFQLYIVMKMCEIGQYRQQDDLRRANTLQIARYVHNLNGAREHHTSALKWALKFWRLASKDRPSVSGLDFASNALHRHTLCALQHYRILIANHPSSTSVLQLFASFSSDVLGQTGIAQDILEYVAKLQEETGKTTKIKTLRSHVSIGGDDDGAEMASAITKSATSGAGDHDLLTSLDASTMFDVESIIQGRDVIALKGVGRLVKGVIASMVLLMTAIIALFISGNVISQSEVLERANVIDAGLARLGAFDLAWLARSFNLATNASFSSSTVTLPALTALQASLLSEAQSTAATVASVVNRTGFLPTSGLVYWSTTPIVDAITGDPMTPGQFFSVLTSKAAYISSADPTSQRSLTAVKWLVANTIPNSFAQFLVDFVGNIGAEYVSNTTYRISAVQYAILAIACVSAMAFVFLVVPSWIRLSNDVTGSRRLYTKVPRRVAQVLSREMSECLREHLERVGMDGVDMLKEVDGSDAQMTRGDGGSSCGEDEFGGGDNASNGGGGGGLGGAGGSGDDDSWHATSSSKTSSSEKSLFRLLLSLFVSLVVLTGLAVAIGYCFITPLGYAEQKVNFVNYSGLRLSLNVRQVSEARELAMLAPHDPAADQWRVSIGSWAQLLTEFNLKVLFGSPELHLPNTFGVPPVDDINWKRTCADLSINCASLQEALTTTVSLARRLINSRDRISREDLSLITTLGSAFGLLRAPIINVRNAFMDLNGDIMAICQTGAVVLFGLVFPMMGIVAAMLYRPILETASCIRRVRNALFQLPESTLDASVREYLDHGILEQQSAPKPKRLLARKSNNYGSNNNNTYTDDDEKSLEELVHRRRASLNVPTVQLTIAS
ncbi:hypothetical protein BC828DRAFT_391233 [Blastocladiella britannica]|nr:hypothetical protein BC828DRAFT_391233 [Blastocladiella britannica]